MPDSDLLQSLVDEVRSSAKYAMLSRELVEQIAREELKNQGNPAKALKSTRTRLHRLAGAFLSQRTDYAKWLDLLKEQPSYSTPEHQETLKRIMLLHASTQERMPFLERVYTDLFALFPKPESILDLACGLNPLAIPWMPIANDIPYLACDIVLPMLNFLKQYFAIFRPKTTITACNISNTLPEGDFDLVMLLKTMPLIAQMDKNAPARFLNTLRFKHLILSYPLKSLGKHQKGMEKTYRAQFETLIAYKPYNVQEYSLPNELFFIISHHD